jgi:hypothetical protein
VEIESPLCLLAHPTEDIALKLLKTKLLSLMLVCAFANNLVAVEPPDSEQCHISWSNRVEMFTIGAFHVTELDGTEKGTFLLNYMPGAKNIAIDAAQHWVHAKDAMKPYLQGEKFWENKIWGGFTGGLKWGWDSNAECGMGAIPRDFSKLWADFKAVKVSEFGGVAHKALDIVGMVASVVCRTVVGTVALVAGTVAAIVVPAVKVVAPACFALGESTVCGLGWPMLKMMWNGAAWVPTQFHTQIPEGTDTMAVTWVPTASTKGTCPTEQPKTEL